MSDTQNTSETVVDSDNANAQAMEAVRAGDTTAAQYRAILETMLDATSGIVDETRLRAYLADLRGAYASPATQAQASAAAALVRAEHALNRFMNAAKSAAESAVKSGESSESAVRAADMANAMYDALLDTLVGVARHMPAVSYTVNAFGKRVSWKDDAATAKLRDAARGGKRILTHAGRIPYRFTIPSIQAALADNTAKIDAAKKRAKPLAAGETPAAPEVTTDETPEARDERHTAERQERRESRKSGKSAASAAE